MINSLAYMITVLRNEFTSHCNGRLAQIDLTQGLLVFIVYIGKKENCSPKQLTNDLRMDAGYANRTLSKLETMGFIKQDINPKDRRARILSLTNKGNDAFVLSHEVFHEWDQRMATHLTTQQYEDMLRILQHLVKIEKGENV